jgi:hypothetical protein
MSTTLCLPIVGQRHHGCATALISALPYHHPLRLIPEPTNPHDPNAVRVVVLKHLLTPSILAQLSPRDNFTLSTLPNLVMLGYIKATEAAKLNDQLCEPDAKLVFHNNHPFALTGEPT